MTLFKRSFKHWTPRYIKDRILNIIDEKLHPDWPWLTKESILILDKLLTKDDVGIEFGSGRSTVWFAKRVKKLISIEHDEFWYKKIKNYLEINNLNNVDYYLLDEEHYLDILDQIQDESIDFCLVDGLLRDNCTLNVLPKIKNCGILIIDNINWFVPNNSRSPNSRRDSYETELWKEIFENKLKNWRRIWTTNGVTDTLILFKCSS